MGVISSPPIYSGIGIPTINTKRLELQDTGVAALHKWAIIPGDNAVVAGNNFAILDVNNNKCVMLIDNSHTIAIGDQEAGTYFELRRGTYLRFFDQGNNMLGSFVANIATTEVETSGTFSFLGGVRFSATNVDTNIVNSIDFVSQTYGVVNGVVTI